MSCVAETGLLNKQYRKHSVDAPCPYLFMPFYWFVKISMNLSTRSLQYAFVINRVLGMSSVVNKRETVLGFHCAAEEHSLY